MDTHFGLTVIVFLPKKYCDKYKLIMNDEKPFKMEMSSHTAIA